MIIILRDDTAISMKHIVSISPVSVTATHSYFSISMSNGEEHEIRETSEQKTRDVRNKILTIVDKE